tara:strand:+ start:324 stop:605 length:282 start_codon:yes stop_codon:yes gene_type:complete
MAKKTPVMNTTPFYRGGRGAVTGLSYEGQGGKNYETGLDSSTDETFIDDGGLIGNREIQNNYQYYMPKPAKKQDNRINPSQTPGIIKLRKPQL